MKYNFKKSMKGTAFSMILPLFIMGEVHANAEDVHRIIDICTSSERVMKDYAMVGMKITYHDPQKDIDDSVKRVNKELKEMEGHKITKSLHAEEEALHTEWSKILGELKNAPTKEGALVLHDHVNTFAKHCETLAEHLAADTGNPAEHYVVLIARLNLDVQELAGTYVLKSWGAIEDKAYYDEVHHILKDFNAAYDELETADEDMVSKSVKEKLTVIKKHFMVFEFMAESKSGRYVPLLIAKKAESIHKETTEILLQEESEVE